MLHRVSNNPLDLMAQSNAGGHEMWSHVNAVLRAILDIAADASDTEFHLCLARGLADALGCQTAFVGELVDGERGVNVQTLSVWSAGEPVNNFQYPLSGTPCEEVFRTGFLKIDRDVSVRFPEDELLSQIHAESYLGAALLASDGTSLGHLAALDNRPILDDESSETILKIFAARATAALELRNAERQLRHVESNFQLLFEQSPNAVILFDPDTWRPIEFNDLAAEFIGYTRDEFSRLTIADLEFEPDPKGTSERIARIVESGGDVFEALHKTKDGTPCHVIVSLRMTTWNGHKVMLTLWHDITARKVAEQALEVSERRLQSIFDSAMDAVVIIDSDLQITRLNTAAEQTFGCDSSSVIGQSIEQFFPGSTLTRLSAEVQTSTSAGSIWAPGGFRVQRTDGSTFPAELTLSQFHIDEAAFFTLILRDVNDRKLAEKELRRLQDEKQLLKEQISENSRIVGASPALANAFTHVEKVAVTDSTVLILGETGTGKELIARAIHDKSVRRDRVLVTVNCAALPRDLLESELFGHEKGAFTGATQQRRGRFELANGGTLFLDEVGELSAEAQAKLLRALQEGEIQRVGGEETVRVNVRVIAATHQDLAGEVEKSHFRSDLYYRLSVFPLSLPPLRERRTDIPLLVDHFISLCAKRFGKPLSGFNDADIQHLQAYDWPGNVRELQNVIERAAILANGERLSLDGSLLQNLPESRVDPGDDLDDVTRAHLLRVLTDCSWVIAGPNGAAARLGLNPSTLRFRMQKLGLTKP